MIICIAAPLKLLGFMLLSKLTKKITLSGPSYRLLDLLRTKSQNIFQKF